MEKQARLHAALLKLGKLVTEARASHQWEVVEGGVTIKIDQEWLGIDDCTWPRCQQGSAYQTSWLVSAGDLSVSIWEIMLHYAEAGHWISFTDISREDQEKLLKIFKT